MGRRCFFSSECESEATVLIASSNMPLCTEHFMKYTESRVWKIINGKDLLKSKSKEKLLVALSGGKDSQTLVYILDVLFHKRVAIEALYVDLHIEANDYSNQSLKFAREFCNTLEIPFHSIDILKEQGYGIDEISNLKYRIKNNPILTKREQEFAERGECSFCGEAKRYYINKFASKNGFSKVLTGHNMDDEATKFLQNWLAMNLFLISRSGPIVDSERENSVPRIKPFYYISEQEIALYCYLKNIPHVEVECPYSSTPSTRFKRIINEINEIQKGSIYGLMKKYQTVLRPVLLKSVDELSSPGECSVCGMLSSGKKCAHCRTSYFVKKHLMLENQKEKIEEEDIESNDDDVFSEEYAKSPDDKNKLDVMDDFDHFYMDDLQEEEDKDKF